MSLQDDLSLNKYDVGEEVDSNVTIPQVVHQESLDNLAPLDAHEFEFAIDYDSVVDGFVSCDVQLTTAVYVRQSSSDAWRALAGVGGTCPADSSVATAIIGPGLRIPGSYMKIVVTNTDVVASTDLSVQFHARSM